MQLHADWLDDPMVRTASDRGDGSALATLTHLHDIMCEVEERFPGVPFGKILAGPTAPVGDLRVVRNTLRRLGACEADIALVAPTPEPAKKTREQRAAEWQRYQAKRREMAVTP